MRCTCPVASSPTQIEPNPATIPVGVPPTVIGVTTFVVGSIRDTVPSSAFATQIASADAATAAGNLPTGIGLPTAAPVAGSIRTSDPAIEVVPASLYARTVTQIDPKPEVTA